MRRLSQHRFVAIIVAFCCACALFAGMAAADLRPRAAAATSGTALAAVSRLQIKPLAPLAGYSRAQFGQAWKDVDQNGCGTRDDILRRDLKSLTARPGTNGCIITSGTLRDPYTATTIQFHRGGGAAVDIDHIDALGEDWRTGAAAWSAENTHPSRERPAEPVRSLGTREPPKRRQRRLALATSERGVRLHLRRTPTRGQAQIRSLGDPRRA